MVRDGGRQEVELVDGPAEPTQPLPGAAAPVRRWWFVAAAGAVVLGLAGVQWVVDAREDAAVARLAAVPGVLAPVGDHLDVVRHLGEAETRALQSSIPVGEDAWASIRVGSDGSQSFTATDLRTGAEIWSTPLLGPHPGRAAGREKSTGGGCEAGDAGADEVPTWAVCTVTDGYSTFSIASGQETVPATTTRVAVLDTTDGHLVTGWDMAHDAQVGVLPGLVLVGLRREGDVEIVAHDARTGAERWRHRDTPAPNTSQPTLSWSFDTAGDVVAYADGEHLTVLSAAGEVVRTDLRSAPAGTLSTDPATGLPILWSLSSDGSATTLLARDADPARDRLLLGRLVHRTVDDGSVPGLVLTAGDRLYAWDEDTGRARWDTELLAGFTALIARGRVVVCDSTEVVALDGDTGEEQWRAEAPGCSFSGLATDGRDVLVPSIASGTGGPGGVAAFDLATGERTRRLGFPDGIVQAQVLGRHLLGLSRTFEEATVLG